MNDKIASVYNLICDITRNKNNYRCQTKNNLRAHCALHKVPN